MENHVLVSPDILTNSAMMTYIRCPEEYRLQYIEMLDPYDLGYTDPDHLTIGSCIHESYEKYVKARMTDEMNNEVGDGLPSYPAPSFPNIGYDAWQQEIKKYLNDDFSHNLITVNGMALMTARIQLEQEGFLPKYTWLSKEVPIGMQYNQYQFAGKPDGQVIDIGADSISDIDMSADSKFIIDHKTSQYGVDYENYLMNTQMILYLAIARANSQTRVDALSWKGYIIDGWRTLSPTGANPRPKKGETDEEYINRCIIDIIGVTKAQAGNFDDELRKSDQLKQADIKPSKGFKDRIKQIEKWKASVPYFQSIIYLLDERQFIAGWNTIKQRADEIQKAKDTGVHRKEWSNCIRYGKYRCPFFDICHNGVSTEHIRRNTTGHVELGEYIQKLNK